VARGDLSLVRVNLDARCPGVGIFFCAFFADTAGLPLQRSDNPLITQGVRSP
jgi:hypothetical protein